MRKDERNGKAGSRFSDLALAECACCFVQKYEPTTGSQIGKEIFSMGIIFRYLQK